MSTGPGYERWIAVLAGGIGSRFWPASTPERPKQFMALASERPLIVDTLERARATAPESNLLIVAGAHLAGPLRKYLPDFPSDQTLLEPRARGTAPALAWAARAILERADAPDRTVMVSLHSDHVIRPLDRFASTIDRAVAAAGDLDRLLTIGVPPSRPETGYGYIQLGEPLEEGVFAVARFVEKPDRARAQDYLESGDFLWNSGIFVWRPARLLAELADHTPELAPHLDKLERGDVEGFFGAVPSLTIDRGLMERSPAIATVEAEFEWDDVGAWPALLRTREPDADGVLLVGDDAQALDCRDSILWAEDGPIVAFGLEGLVVARAGGITFVASLERAADLKDLLETLPPELRQGGDG